jgi:hypothetical protein
MLATAAALGLAAYYYERLAMSKPNKNRYRLSEVRSQVADAVGGDTIVAETDDGQEFTLEHPMFRSPATEEALADLDEDDSEGIARVVLGDTQWNKFAKAGGTASDINRLLMAVGMNMQDEMRGRPTRFSTYSASTPRQ